MLVQLNRTIDHRDFAATSTDLPINAAGGPAVAVLGHPGRIAGLNRHLPAEWTLRTAKGLNDVRPDEIVLCSGASVREIAAARRVLPARALIVAVVDGQAPADLVAGVLTAGADVCVRGGQPAILAGHLQACRRRDLTGRWPHLDRQGRR